MVNWLSLVVPFAYLTILLGSLYTFSHLYRARKLSKAASLEPWFPPHLQRNIYLTLLHLDPSESGEGGPSKVPDSVLKAALLRRATEDIHRVLQVQNAKPALQSLLQRGSVGDDLWQRFLRAEKEIQEEIKDVVAEANAFAPGWGQLIFQTANEMAQNALLRKRVEEIQAQVTAEKEWWEKKKAGIQADFMKELDEDSKATQAVPTTGRGSDDDAVLVEGGGPTAAQQQGSMKKRKKGKN
ncbi:Translocation protein S66 [Coniosporium apollinis]|uniref:Translocation protein S66 n=2 Tax=Coniosporium TaxID=2810619 RepID=A0ABQ9P3D3_9PEZI|nr:Translocation protein S66 [Cladosporium sp. JES 115]KAJ9669104.1 Translocation protein S66 [Coniosporium apollinis]